MRNHPSTHRLRLLAGVMLATLTTGPAWLHAGEVPILNSNFDELAPSPAWSWENWSRAGSTVTYDPAVNAAGGAEGSGSLRLTGPFDPNNTGWQEAVFTLDIADFDASKLQSLSFDVMVDPASTQRVEGDYGNIQVILRNGSNWDWRQQTMVVLTNTSWQRVTVKLADGEQPINDIRAITVRIAQNGMRGTVTAWIDNIAFTEELIVDNFDDGNADGWTATWATLPEVTYSTLDRYGRETSGSLRVAANYFDPAVTSWQQAVITVPFAQTEDAAKLYTQISCDVRVDPSSTLTQDGNYGYFEIKRPDGTVIGSGVNLSGNDWTHLSFDIPPSIPPLSGIIIQLGNNGFLGPVIYNLDNLSWTKRDAPPPPPTLTLARAQGGLNLVHTSTDQYGRHNIYTADSSALGFYDVQDVASVSYSFTLAKFPTAESAPGFQAHMFLVPGNPGTETGPDWNEPTLLFLDVRAGANGTGSATLRWKANQANGNSQLYAGGLPTVNSATVLGTWMVTADSAGHVTVTAPDNATTAMDLATTVAPLFAGPIRMYIGVQGNSQANIGQRALLGGARITQQSTFGDATTLLEDDFSGDALDLGKWVINAFAGGVQFLTSADAGWIVTWTLPDDGFTLEYTTTLEEFPFWVPSASVPVAVGPFQRQASIPKSELPPDTQTVFWRLSKP